MFQKSSRSHLTTKQVHQKIALEAATTAQQQSSRRSSFQSFYCQKQKSCYILLRAARQMGAATSDGTRRRVNVRLKLLGLMIKGCLMSMHVWACISHPTCVTCNHINIFFIVTSLTPAGLAREQDASTCYQVIADVRFHKQALQTAAARQVPRQFPPMLLNML